MSRFIHSIADISETNSSRRFNHLVYTNPYVYDVDNGDSIIDLKYIEETYSMEMITHMVYYMHTFMDLGYSNSRNISKHLEKMLQNKTRNDASAIHGIVSWCLDNDVPLKKEIKWSVLYYTLFKNFQLKYNNNTRQIFLYHRFKCLIIHYDHFSATILESMKKIQAILVSHPIMSIKKSYFDFMRFMLQRQQQQEHQQQQQQREQQREQQQQTDVIEIQVENARKEIIRVVDEIVTNENYSLRCKVCLIHKICVVIPCGHAFCYTCLNKLDLKCAVCRESFSPTSVVRLFV